MIETPEQLIAQFATVIPHDCSHMLCYFAAHAANGRVLPFVNSLAQALYQIDAASPGYAISMIDRIAAVRGVGEDPYESLIQLLAEIYVATGAVEIADQDDDTTYFHPEPGNIGQKNPEFEVRVSGEWVAVEVKTPRLIDYSRRRASTEMQLTARLPNGPNLGEPLLPRDNPVKDFLSSAQAKFAGYRTHRAGALHLLAIIWDDFIQEPVAALLNPNSGLLTPRSFATDSSGIPIRFDLVDGIILIRHQHQLIRATREEPLLDGQQPFVYHGPPFPPKALVPNPNGRVIPEHIRSQFGLQLCDDLPGAEYRPPDLIFWL